MAAGSPQETTTDTESGGSTGAHTASRPSTAHATTHHAAAHHRSAVHRLLTVHASLLLVSTAITLLGVSPVLLWRGRSTVVSLLAETTASGRTGKLALELVQETTAATLSLLLLLELLVAILLILVWLRSGRLSY